MVQAQDGSPHLFGASWASGITPDGPRSGTPSANPAVPGHFLSFSFDIFLIVPHICQTLRKNEGVAVEPGRHPTPHG